MSDRAGRVRLAVSDRTPTVSTTSDAWREARSHEAGFAGVEWNDTVDVEATTLDALIAAYGEPAFVKLDVEGAEAAALQGLSVPVKGLSFEYLGGALASAEACATRLAALAPYRFNWSAGESSRLGVETWLDHRALVERLSSAPRGRARRRLRAEAQRMSAGTVGAPVRSVNSARQILVASLIGTTIEFFDFYIYATAAVLVFPQLFFPGVGSRRRRRWRRWRHSRIAFLARPIGSALFGHFGDRIGRKTTLVAALLTMGVSTVAIGLLPTYATIGLAAPLLLALCRFGQGLGLGGEWGGAMLLATENAPPGKRAWYGMFPQLGAPIGFFLLRRVFLLLSRVAHRRAVLRVGLARAVSRERGAGGRRALRAAGDHRNAGLRAAVARHERVKVPMVDGVPRPCAGAGRSARSSASLAIYVIFYLMTVFTLSWGTAHSATAASSSC